tara:strand:+ start:1196 stop:2260 length:1065 start_codon:yes stop_codon:yes gene_type:complete
MKHILRQDIQNAFVLDIDGTLLRYDDAIDGSSNFISFLQEQNIPHVYLSNTGEKTASIMAAKMSSILKIYVNPSLICTAMDYMCDTLSEEFSNDIWDTILVIAPNELWKNKLKIGTDFSTWKKPYHTFTPHKTCIALFSDGNVPNYYENLKRISELIDDGVSFCASSEDETLVKMKEGKVLKCPGPGMFINILKKLTSQDKLRCFGKGSSECMSVKALQMIKSQDFYMNKGWNNHQIWFVGDRCDTDIRAGKNQGVKTCLVESGCHKESDINYDVPDAIASSISDLFNSYKCLNDSTIRRSLLKFVSRIAFRSSNIVGNGVIKEMFRVIESQICPPPRRVRSYPDMQSMDSSYL